MKKLVCVTAVLGALAAVGAGTPASAAVYCFDGAGRPLGSGWDHDAPNYRQIELARRLGGHCRDLGPGRSLPHVEGNGHYYNNGGYRNGGYHYRQPKHYRHSDHGYQERKDYRYAPNDRRYHKAPDYSKPQPPVENQLNTAN